MPRSTHSRACRSSLRVNRFILQPLGILDFVFTFCFWQQYPGPEFVAGGFLFSMALALRVCTQWDGEMLELDEKGL